MAQQIDLKQAERQVFQVAFIDGLWDVFLGCMIMLFAAAPLLSNRLGDFWSSMVFLPFWGFVYLAVGLVRKHIVFPRLGIVKYGPASRIRLTRFSLLMLVFNSMLFAMGLIAYFSYQGTPGQIYPLFLGMLLLVAFSLAAALLGFYRLYFYGLMAGLSPLIGEWLWTRGLASHHGFPITFGFTAAVMVVVGVVVFLRFLRDNPLPLSETSSEVTQDDCSRD